MEHEAEGAIIINNQQVSVLVYAILALLGIRLVQNFHYHTALVKSLWTVHVMQRFGNMDLH